jgi:hypothetical protein
MVKYPTNFCTLELCNRAGEMLKRAGFVHYQTSMKTEATYYRWPGRKETIRVADHPRKTSGSNRNNIAAKITFHGRHIDPPGMMNISDEKVSSKVAYAIGTYFLKSATTPAEED